MCRPTLYLLKFACVFVLMAACGGTFAESKCGCGLPQSELSDRKSHDEWDYLQFVVQWPQSVCRKYNYSGHHRAGRKCIVPRNIRHWTIHGTWPTKIGTFKPQCCNASWNFSLEDINDLLPEMNQSWPNLFVGDSLGSFWCHEWDTHGTCCANLPAMHGEHNYFSKTLEFRRKFDIDNALSVGGIVPSKSVNYTLDDIQQAVRNATGVIPNLKCVSLPTNHGSQQYLSEIRLCLNKTFEPRDCPKIRRIGNIPVCPDTEIALPPIEGTGPDFGTN